MVVVFSTLELLLNSLYLGHADRGVIESLLDERDAHRVLALLSLEKNCIPVKDCQL